MRKLLLLALFAAGCSQASATGFPWRKGGAAAVALTYDQVVTADSATLIRRWRLLDGNVANAGSIVESSGFAGGPYTATSAAAWTSAAAIVTGDASSMTNDGGGGTNASATFTTTGNLTDFTVCFWLKLPVGTPDYQLGVLSSGGCNSGDTMIWGNGGTVSLSFNGSTNVVADPNAKDTARHFYCFVRTSGSLHLWVDGVDAANGSNSTNAVFTRFGSSGCGTNTAQTDSEMEIHNAALSSGRIGARWTAGQ